MVPTRFSSCSTLRIVPCSCRHCSSSRSTVMPRRRRRARRRMASVTSRSRSTSAIAGNGGSSVETRWVFKNSCGSANRRARIAALASRQAAYNWPASRQLNRSFAIAAAMRTQSSAWLRAIGTRYFMATCAASAPLRTCCCTLPGSSSTNPIRRDTQLTLRSKRRANSSCPYPKRSSNSTSSQPCSSAVSCCRLRRLWSRSRASASPNDQTTASTVSRPSCWSAVTRW